MLLHSNRILSFPLRTSPKTLGIGHRESLRVLAQVSRIPHQL